jgi:hypothetical protein
MASTLWDLLAGHSLMSTLNLQDIAHSNNDIDVDARRALLPGVWEHLPVSLQWQAVRCLGDDCGDACYN